MDKNDEDVDYRSVLSFTRAFLRDEGDTPGQYRLRARTGGVDADDASSTGEIPTGALL